MERVIFIVVSLILYTSIIQGVQNRTYALLKLIFKRLNDFVSVFETEKKMRDFEERLNSMNETIEKMGGGGTPRPPSPKPPKDIEGI